MLLVSAYAFLLHCMVVVFAATRAKPASLAVLTSSFAMLMTFLFQSRKGIWSTSALHLGKDASGHLVVSRSWIIMQVTPLGQCLLLQWQEAHRHSNGFGSLTKGIILYFFPLKIRYQLDCWLWGPVAWCRLSWHQREVHGQLRNRRLWHT